MSKLLSGLISTFLNKSTTSSTLTRSAASKGISGADQSIFGKVRPICKRSKRRPRIPKPQVWPEPNPFKDKPVQSWWDWDGFGRYAFRSHSYPDNRSLRDVQRRRVFKKFAEERLRINSLRKATDVLPAEIRRIADREIHDNPRSAAITRVNRRCVITGRPRGIFHQFRVSRFIFRHEADYNKLSGVQRAYWRYNTHIKP